MTETERKGDGAFQTRTELRIENTSTSEQVAGALRDAILRGEIVPGQAIEESACVETFGISRNTAREAIRELARGGLVVQARRRPATVTTLTAEDVVDIFRMRRLLELGAVDLADASENVVFSQIEHAIDEMASLSGTTEWRRLGDVDHAFHEAIVALPGSRRLSRTYTSIQAEVRLCLSLTDRWDTEPSDQVRKHREIADCLLAGDWEASKELLASHMDDAESRVLKVLEGSASADANEPNVLARKEDRNV